MAQHQGPRRHAAYQVIIDGTDISPKIDPYLISLQVIDSYQRGHDTAHIELDDSYGILQIPPDGVSLMVLLGWAGEGPRVADYGRKSEAGGQGPLEGFDTKTDIAAAIQAPWGGPGLTPVFSGVVSNCESGFGRKGGGRRLWIEATSGDVRGTSKQLQRKHWGEGSKDDSQSGQQSGGGAGGGMIPLKTVLTDMFSKVGMTVQMSGDIADVKQDYWNVNDSPANFLSRIARDRGGLSKIANNVAMIIPAAGGINSRGQKLSVVDAVWGVNMIGWRIKPYAGRPQYGSAQTRFFKTFDAVWDSASKSIGGETPFGGASAITHAVASVANKTEGDSTNSGSEQMSNSKRGKGWVLLNGEPLCIAGSHILITGARPGVDGTYLIVEAEHNYTRAGGYTTRANVQYPEPVVNPGIKWKQKKPSEKAPPEPVVKPQSSDPTKPGYVAPQVTDPRAPGYIQPQYTDPKAPGYIEPQSYDPNAPGYFDPKKTYGPFEPGGLFNPIPTPRRIAP
jgi:Bacteriophage probable baseplate hub protein